MQIPREPCNIASCGSTSIPSCILRFRLIEKVHERYLVSETSLYTINFANQQTEFPQKLGLGGGYHDKYLVVTTCVSYYMRMLQHKPWPTDSFSRYKTRVIPNNIVISTQFNLNCCLISPAQPLRKPRFIAQASNQDLYTSMPINFAEQCIIFYFPVALPQGQGHHKNILHKLQAPISPNPPCQQFLLHKLPEYS